METLDKYQIEAMSIAYCTWLYIILRLTSTHINIDFTRRLILPSNYLRNCRKRKSSIKRVSIPEQALSTTPISWSLNCELLRGFRAILSMWSKEKWTGIKENLSMSVSLSSNVSRISHSIRFQIYWIFLFFYFFFLFKFIFSKK